MKMKLYWIRLTLIVMGLGACSTLPGPAAPQPPPVVAGTAPVTPTLTSALTVHSSQPPPKLISSPTPNVLLPIQKTLGGQIVQINAQDLQTVTTPGFTLIGQAPSGTVVSVNDDFVLVDGSRTFSFELSLQEGPNLIEIVASNAQEQQVSFEWVIIYDPTP
jgi:hypothetical protein